MSWNNRKKYPKNWEELSKVCRDTANWKCEQCEIAEGEWQVGEHRVYQVKLAAAHLDHDPWNPNPRLKALCPDCHFKHDAPENGKKALRTRRINIRNAMLKLGQLAIDWESAL